METGSMLLAFLLLASVADWVPMRWISAEPKSLEILDGTPVNCVVLEPDRWTTPFIAAAHGRGMAVLGVIRPGAEAAASARKAADVHLDGVVFEGDFDKTE